MRFGHRPSVSRTADERLSAVSLLLSPASKRPAFHRLAVASIDRLTPDAVALWLAVPESLRSEFSFDPGQYLTLRQQILGQDVRRSYSLCLSPRQARESGMLRVATSRIAGGAMSNWLIDEVVVGQEIAALRPLGEFAERLLSEPPQRLIAVAAGSGVTPILSIVQSALELESAPRVYVVLGNRSPQHVMFASQWADLERAHPESLRVLHVYSGLPEQRSVMDKDQPTGRLSASVLKRALAQMPGGVEPLGGGDWYLCGPLPVVEAGQEVATELGALPEQVHREIFYP